MERVTLRYETGTTTGHYVAPDKVRERYQRPLALLPRAAEIADAVYVYDNSIDFEKPALQAVIERGAQFSVSPDAKDRVIQRLVQPLQQRERELDELLTALENAGVQTGETDELNGKYTGTVLLTTTYYLAQRDDDSAQAVIHDRLMLDTVLKSTGSALPEYRQNEKLTICYSPAGAPHIERQ